MSEEYTLQYNCERCFIEFDIYPWEVGLTHECEDCRQAYPPRELTPEERERNRKLSKRAWESIKRRHGYRCVYCGVEDETLVKDHVIPIKSGGKTVPENIVPACRTCNASKGSKEVTRWVGERNSVMNLEGLLALRAAVIEYGSDAIWG